MLVHVARSAMRTAEDKDDRLSRWITNLQEKRHANVAAVALANKLARISWVIMSKGVEYDLDFSSAT
jgi:transposase